VKRYPEIPVCVKVANSQEIERKLLLNELDFGFMDAPAQPEAFISHKIREDAVRIVCAKEYPIEAKVTFEQFKRHPLLVRETGSGSRQILEQWFAMEGERPNIVMESSDGYSLKEICRCGFGLLILTESMIEGWAEENEFRTVEVAGNHGKRSCCLVYHKSKYLTRSMRYFKEYTL
jgi:DNA-binding transcriptional LysR family regulator